MKPLHVSEDIVPIGQFKAQAPRWLRHVAERGAPVVITQNGKPAGVLLSPAAFDELTYRQRFIAAVEEGLAAAEAGQVMTTAEVRRRLAQRRAARRKR